MSEISISSTTTEVNRTGSWKYIRPIYVDRDGPCRHRCPTNVNVPAYMALLRSGRIAEAAAVLLRDNPLPAITGRVCDHPCEAGCNRAHFDGAVAVHAVERMLGDYVLESPLPPPVQVLHEEKVAVVGSGPAGLACASYLTSSGYRVEIFEQDSLPGGMLRAGIPEYRLPRTILDAQIERLEALGVRFNCGFRVGEDITWAALTTEFAAVFIATGAHISKPPGFDIPVTHAIWSGLDFLRVVNRGERPPVGGHVVVVGGGNTAIDCARTARRLGAEVTVAYRRTRAEMPALSDEITDAEHEGVRFLFLASPTEVRQGARGLEMICDPMTLGEPDASGRRKPVRDDAPPFTVDCDTVITAIGEEAELGIMPEGLTPDIDEWGTSRSANIFMGGDVVSNNRTVAYAIAAGKRAAHGIDRYLNGCRGESCEDDAIDALIEPVSAEQVNTNHFERALRHKDRRTDHVLPFAETNIGLTHDDALAEAARCFECGACNSCELCLLYCADNAIVRSANGSRFKVLLEYCKGCGVCAAECPRGAIVMTREGL